MDSKELQNKTKKFALRIMKLVEALPDTKAGRVVGNQILRSATSVGANYRSACKARSKADFISKITVVEEEADETAFWLELIQESNLINPNKVKDLYNEAKELAAIFTSSGKTAKMNSKFTNRNSKSQTDIPKPKNKNP